MKLTKADKSMHFKKIYNVFCHFTKSEAKNKDIVVYGTGFNDVPSAVVAKNLKEAGDEAEKFTGQSYGCEMKIEDLRNNAKKVTLAVYDFSY